MAHFRSPRRISITVSHATYERLIQRSDSEGRSLSNLAAYLLEVSTESTQISTRKLISIAAA